MSSKFTAEEILQMVVEKIETDMAADLDGDGKVTTADARIAQRRELGLDNEAGNSQEDSALSAPSSPSGYNYAPDEGLSMISSSILDKILNTQNSDFDINSDKLYNQYKEMYTKNASLSAENTFGLASAFTGGYGNSYAASAASAAYNSYMSGLQDKAIEIEKLYDSRKKDELSNLYKALEAVNSLEEKNYSRYQDSISLAFNAAKQGDYSLLKSLGIDVSKLKDADALEKAETAAKYGDYSYLEKLGIDTSSLLEKERLQKAVQAAEYGDYSYLSSLGINTNLFRYNELLKTASALAEYGDYSALELLGVDVSSLIETNQFQRALELAKYGDYSLLGSFSDNLSGIRQKISTTIQKGAQEAYAGGGYSALLKYLNKQVGYGQINESAKKQIISVVTGGKYGN